MNDYGIKARMFIEECLNKFKVTAIQKNRSFEPWEKYSKAHLLRRLVDETTELLDARTKEEVMGECLDVANFAWFIYEKMRLEIEEINKELK